LWLHHISWLVHTMLPIFRPTSLSNCSFNSDLVLLGLESGMLSVNGWLGGQGRCPDPFLSVAIMRQQATSDLLSRGYERCAGAADLCDTARKQWRRFRNWKMVLHFQNFRTI
jgi:hypothetical protein